MERLCLEDDRGDIVPEDGAVVGELLIAEVLSFMVEVEVVTLVKQSLTWRARKSFTSQCTDPGKDGDVEIPEDYSLQIAAEPTGFGVFGRACGQLGFSRATVVQRKVGPVLVLRPEGVLVNFELPCLNSETASSFGESESFKKALQFEHRIAVLEAQNGLSSRVHLQQLLLFQTPTSLMWGAQTSPRAGPDKRWSGVSAP